MSEVLIYEAEGGQTLVSDAGNKNLMIRLMVNLFRIVHWNSTSCGSAIHCAIALKELLDKSSSRRLMDNPGLLVDGTA